MFLVITTLATDADIVCARGRHHFAPDFELSDTHSQAQSVNVYKEMYQEIHPNQKKMMFFSVCTIFCLVRV